MSLATLRPLFLLLGVALVGCTDAVGVVVGPDLGSPCPAAQSPCGDACVDLANDVKNCGACGTACDPGNVCVGGHCILTCALGLTACSASDGGAAAGCVNLKTDVGNCGACGKACPPGNVCSNGQCAVSCQQGLTDCSGLCVNLESDNANCGVCGMACPMGQVCSNGQCAVSCQTGLTNCNGGCVNLATDNSNCGACATACAMGQVCSNSQCAVSCQPGYTVCSGACANLKYDIANCGMCGNACPPGNVCSNGQCAVSCQVGLTACNGLCTNLQSDLANCGMCGSACPPGNVCAAGQCAVSCVNGYSVCGGICVNLQIDLANCGQCGTACAMGQFCVGGVCGAKPCMTNNDCPSLVCTNNRCADPACNDMVKNGDESDVDCGGSCPPCAVGKGCRKGGDCTSGLCFNGLCVTPSCGDMIKNGSETDVDCGGNCPPCSVGKGCLVNGDCIDGACINNQCAPPTCNDMIKNGQETDVDCGGPMCPVCATNLGCKKGTDCASGICVNSQCQIPSCMDGVKNGNETDIDCGGMCPACAPAKGCMANGDCWNGLCQNGVCGHDAAVSVGGQGNPPFNANGDGSKLVVLDNNGNVTVDRANALLKIARYIYVSNSGEGTVSKIDPTTFKEVGRYCTAPGCNADPSRASVSLDGDAGIANRASYFLNGVQHPERASAVKIAGDLARCVDRNGNGKIDTATGSTAIPWPVNTTQSPDECVLWWTPLTRDRNGNQVGGAGTLPRSATWDSKSSPNGSLSSNFYVGLYGTQEVAQLDAATGAIVQQVAVGGAPYSSVFDRFGYLWIRDAISSRMIRVDTTKPGLPSAFVGPTPPCNYAITADSRGYIYDAGNTCVARMDPSSNNPQWESLSLPGACFPRGSSLDANFNYWVSDTCYGGYRVDASKPWGQGMTVVKQLPLTPNSGAYFLGTAIDGNGIPYFINTETSNLGASGGPNGTVYRVDPNNNYAITNIRVGTTPYVYSDLSGSQLALTAPTTGEYRKTFQSYCGSNATWTTMTWTDTVPQGTTLQVRYRAAADLVSLQTAPFVVAGTEPPAIAQPAAIALPNGTNTSYFQVSFGIATSDTQNKPTLGSVTVNYTCP